MLVVIESPFAPTSVFPPLRWWQQYRNIRYARLCMLDSLGRGESPFASHLLYPQVLNDDLPVERAIGITAGLLWGRHARLTVVYTDLGITAGMREGADTALLSGRKVEYRKLTDRRQYA